MSTQPNPLQRTGPWGTNAPAPSSAPSTSPDANQSPQTAGGGGFFSRLGEGLKKVMPYVTPIANRLAAAAGNYAPLELEHRQKELELQQSHEATSQQLAASQMQNQELSRQLLSKQIENVRTPEQQATAKLSGETAEAQMKTQFETPKDVVAPMPSGGMGHYSQTPTYDPVAKRMSLQTAPTMVDREVPNPNEAEAMPMPPLRPKPTITQREQLPAMSKPISAGGDIEPDQNSPTGFSKVWRGANFAELHREPAPAPYAYVPQSTTSTVQQVGPTGLHEVNTTNTVRQPAAGGVTPPVPQTRPPVPNAVNLSGAEIDKTQSQNVTLDQTNAIIDRLRASKQQFASLVDAGLITLAVDPARGGVAVAFSSRNLTPQQQKVAGDWQSLAEHINILRQPLGGTGFRSEEAWGALQAQRGRLMQAPGVIDQTLNNTQQILHGLREKNRKLLGPLDTSSQTPTSTFQHF